MAAPNFVVLRPNLGLFLDRPPETVPPRGLVDCHNVRIKNGRIEAVNMGWTKFLSQPLNGPVTLIDNFFLSAGTQLLIFGTPTDLYVYNEGAQTVSFITPRYETGTVAVNNGSKAVVGTGTSWQTNVKPGDAIHFGEAGHVDDDGTWYTVENVDSDTQLTLTEAYAGSTASGLDYTIRQLFQGSLDAQWQTETFPLAAPSGKDYWFATNGVDWIVRWDGIADQVEPLPQLGFTCGTLARFKNMMIYGDINENGNVKPYSIKNSDAGDPTELMNGIANEFVVSDGVAPVLVMFDIGDTLAIYTEREIILAQFVGDPIGFIFRTAVSGIGPIASGLVADFGDFHEFVGADGQYSFNGVGVELVGDQVFREVLRKQDPSRRGRAISHFDEENGDLIWAIPLTTDSDPNGGPEVAYVEHYVENVSKEENVPFTKRDFPFTATGFFERLQTLRFSDLVAPWADQNYRWDDRFFQAAFPYNLVGDKNGYVYILSSADTQDGQGFVSYATFGRRAIGDLRQRNLVKRVYPFVDPLPAATYPLIVTTVTYDRVSGGDPNTAVQEFDLTQSGKRFVSPFKRGRIVQVQFGTPGPAQPWFLNGYDLDVAVGGER